MLLLGRMISQEQNTKMSTKPISEETSIAQVIIPTTTINFAKIRYGWIKRALFNQKSLV